MDVYTVARTRAGLSTILKSFRAGNHDAVVLGSHRRPEAVIVPFADYSSETVSRQSALDVLQRQSPVIHRLAEANRITEVAAFGSIARRQEDERSDVDLLVTPTATATLFDLARFQSDMEALTGRKVDIVSRASLDPASPTDARILSEATPL